MHRLHIGAIALAVVLLAACAPEKPTCTAPYIENGRTCCLDRDADSACDPQRVDDVLNCDLCPPKFVAEKQEVVVYKYVCMNGSIVDTALGCGERVVSDAAKFTINELQDAEKILAFESRPACRGPHRVAEIHLHPWKAARAISVQVQRDPGAFYETALTLNGTTTILDDEYIYLGFCSDCEELADIELPADGAYAVRAIVHYASDDITTRDLLIDPTPEGEYGSQRC